MLAVSHADSLCRDSIAVVLTSQGADRRRRCRSCPGCVSVRGPAQLTGSRDQKVNTVLYRLSQRLNLYRIVLQDGNWPLSDVQAALPLHNSWLSLR